MKISSYYNRIKRIGEKFKLIGQKHNGPTGFFSFCKYVRFRLFYKTSLEDYFSYKLYDRSQSRKAYYASNHTAIHKWSNVKSKFAPTASSWQLFWLKIDYIISKIRYPGLDAMDYFRYEFYNFRHAKRKTFITEGYLAKMDHRFNEGEQRRKSTEVLEQKNKFNEEFSEFINRKWISFPNASKEEVVKFCESLDKVIVKPLDGGMGRGIYIFEINNEEDVLTLYEKVKDTNSIIEEVIIQHKDISALNPSSVNTIRVYSVSFENEIYITGGTLRIGCGDTPIDNYSAGGMAAEINIDCGIIVSPAVSQNAEKYYIHPYSKVAIIGLKIPKWPEIVELVKKAHSKIPELGYVGWDVVVCADNSITFLEANTCPGVALQQHPGLTGKKDIYSKFL